MTRKKRLDEKDFPLETEKTSVTTRKGEPVATAETPTLADELAERLNEDAERRHEDKWSA